MTKQLKSAVLPMAFLFVHGSHTKQHHQTLHLVMQAIIIFLIVPLFKILKYPANWVLCALGGEHHIKSHQKQDFAEMLEHWLGSFVKSIKTRDHKSFERKKPERGTKPSLYIEFGPYSMDGAIQWEVVQWCRLLNVCSDFCPTLTDYGVSSWVSGHLIEVLLVWWVKWLGLSQKEKVNPWNIRFFE